MGGGGLWSNGRGLGELPGLLHASIPTSAFASASAVIFALVPGLHCSALLWVGDAEDVVFLTHGEPSILGTCWCPLSEDRMYMVMRSVVEGRVEA